MARDVLDDNKFIYEEKKAKLGKDSDFGNNTYRGNEYLLDYYSAGENSQMIILKIFFNPCWLGQFEFCERTGVSSNSIDSCWVCSKIVSFLQARSILHLFHSILRLISIIQYVYKSHFSKSLRCE